MTFNYVLREREREFYVNANVKFWTDFSANASAGASGKDLRERERSSKTFYCPGLVVTAVMFRYYFSTLNCTVVKNTSAKYD